MAMCIAAEEQEEAEKRTQRRKYSVIPYLKERSFKGRYASDLQSTLWIGGEYLIPKRNTRPDAIPLKAKLAIVLESATPCWIHLLDQQATFRNRPLPRLHSNFD
ncbi:uncharacterized protein [Drosophila suzukii]